MGRRTYEQALSFGEYPYKDKKSFVFSRTHAGKGEHVTFISDDIPGFIRELKRGKGKDIWLVGGSQVIHTCMSNDLIDEFVISVHPVILGEGIPLFRSPLPMRELSFKRCRTFKTGLVQLTYVNRACCA